MISSWAFIWVPRSHESPRIDEAFQFLQHSLATMRELIGWAVFLLLGYIVDSQVLEASNDLREGMIHRSARPSDKVKVGSWILLVLFAFLSINPTYQSTSATERATKRWRWRWWGFRRLQRWRCAPCELLDNLRHTVQNLCTRSGKLVSYPIWKRQNHLRWRSGII